MLILIKNNLKLYNFNIFVEDVTETILQDVTLALYHF